MFSKTILDFPSQFAFEPKIENSSKLIAHSSRYLICGMGGSAFPGDILRALRPDADIWVWRDYGLPPLADLDERTIIVSSYSGNTEEAISALDAAIEKNLNVVAVSTGGVLLQKAREAGVPFIMLPATGIQPRMATGFMIRAFLSIMSDDKVLEETRALADSLKPSELEEAGKTLAKKLKGTVPIIYTSNANAALARVWKIKLNESGKIPAFWNTLPEVNHNEMTGFDISETTKGLSPKFYFLFLEDPADNPHMKKRFSALVNVYHEERGLPVERIEMQGGSRSEAIFKSLLLADWVSYHTALLYGVEPEEVPMVEEFKKSISS